MIRKCYVIAEAGLNHNGDVARAILMARTAKWAGCDGFKIQAYTASEFVGPNETYTYTERLNDGMRRVTEKQRELFERCALTIDGVEAVHAECMKQGLVFVATVTDPLWLDRIRQISPQAVIKIGSDDLIHRPLLHEVAASGMRCVLSTGMASEEEVEVAVGIVRPMTLLHCVSLYPTPPAKANLRRMLSLAKFGYDVGFSDHTEGSLAAMMAASMGATMIEKHFTIDQNLPGPDHWFSATPSSMRELCKAVAFASASIGDGYIEPGPEEKEMRRIARRSVVAAHDIPPGTALRQEMVAYRRPGMGLAPGTELPLLGRITTRTIHEGELLDESILFSSGEVVH